MPCRICTTSGTILPQTIWTLLTVLSTRSLRPLNGSPRCPALGHVREDLTAQPLRFWTVGVYLVIYRAERTPIEIVAVTRGGRDIPRLLRRR
jgi:plasmid stabilization system protein ParE